MKFSLLVIAFLFVTGMVTSQEIELDTLIQNNSQIIILKNSKKKDIRKNPDGEVFNNTSFNIKIKYENKNLKIRIPGNYYFSDKKESYMTPRVLLDSKDKKLYVFLWEKDEHERDYGMTGYLIEYSIDTKKFTKEVVFTRSNMGWYSYLTKSVNNELFLSHFSYSGRFNMLSIRQSNNIWKNLRIERMKNTDAKDRYLKHRQNYNNNLKK